MPEDLVEFLRKVFQELTTVSSGVSILFSLGLAAGVYLLVRYLLLGILLRWLRPERNSWLKTIVEARIPHLLTLLVPPVVVRAVLPYYSLETISYPIAVLSRLLAFYVAVVVAIVLNGILLAVNNHYNSLEYSRTFPISSILDVVRVVVFVLVGAVIISILFNIEAVYILAAIGAIIAAGTVVFNNLIMAFVAGLILTSKKLIMIYDWIELPELGINGEVQEITLTTVIVRNRDHTIGTVPSTYLLANSFKNWRGVLEAGAREMFWPITIDVNSVKPVDRELLDQIAGLPHCGEILRRKAQAEPGGKSSREIPLPAAPNTNLGLFREYCALYLQNHPRMAPHRLLSVYFEAPTKFGIPMQVMVSTGETDYERFLDIQSDLMEEFLLLSGKFGLKVFQIEDGVASKSIRSLVKEPES